MKKTNIRRLFYHIRHHYFTLNNVVIAVALLIGASWAWGSVGMMQRNFDLQKSVDARSREAELVELEMQNLTFEQKYYKSGEYQELAVRERSGLAMSGEKVLVLPPNTEKAKSADVELADKPVKKEELPTNFELWVNFLFGGNRNES